MLCCVVRSLHQLSVCGAAVRNKLLMLLVPFLKRWTYTRTREQVNMVQIECYAHPVPDMNTILCVSDSRGTPIQAS